MSATVNRDLENMLNRMTPAAAYAKMGTMLNEMIKAHNDLLTKLDADTGVASTDYAATLRVKTLAERM